MDKPEVSDHNIHYIDGFNNNYIITCNKDSCKSEKRSNNSYYFFDVDNNKNIISCTNDGCFSEEAKQGIYIQIDGTSNDLIKCNSDGCEYIVNSKTCAEESDEGNVSYVRYTVEICTDELIWKSFTFTTYGNYIIKQRLANKYFSNVTTEYALILTDTPGALIYEDSMH